MKSNEELKQIVRLKYSGIALQGNDAGSATCSPSGCTPDFNNIMTDDYSTVDGYAAQADLGLGCGLPTKFARIAPGHTVIDLGSGAGNDCFIARAETGETGKVLGIDFTPAMIDKARENAAKLGFANVEFRQGDIEQLPVESGFADVIVSNCVLNLVPDKPKVFGEIFRTLKPGGHFSISDIVLEGILPAGLQEAAEMYAGCVAGAIQKQDYLSLIEAAGFGNMTIQKEKIIELPAGVLTKYLGEKELADFIASGTGIKSITVFAQKPASAPVQPA